MFLGSSIRGDFKSEGREKRAKLETRTGGLELQLVSSDPKAQRQGLHFEFTCMRPRAHLGKKLAVCSNTGHNLQLFQLYHPGEKFIFFLLFFLFLEEQPKC